MAFGIHDLVRLQAARSPDRIAVEWQGGVMRYADLIARSARLAHFLRSHGVKQDKPVGVLLSRGPEMIVTILAILQAGGYYVPLDPEDMPERQTYILRNTGCELFVSDLADHPFSGLDAPPSTVIELDKIMSHVARQPAEPPDVPVAPSQIAYVMYTSGSTGQPKGVVVEHDSVINLARADFVTINARETLLSLAPLAFDLSTFEIWGALCNGARLVLAPAQLLDPDQIGNLVADSGVTILALTAGLFHVAMEARPAGLGGLSTLLAGGEALSPPQVLTAVKILPGTKVSNCYGPTEATTFTTVTRPLSTADIDDFVPIGSALTGTQVLVLDADLQLVPENTVGELYISGAGLARGYTDPRLTAERFVPNPYSDAQGARMYRTGDLVQRRPDDSLIFIGRVDNQIKVRGHRVEPAEVESLLARYPGVRQVCCIPQTDPGGGLQLAAYVFAENVSVTDLRAYAAEKLPPYMRPAQYRLVADPPLTRNGKLDRQALSQLKEELADHPEVGALDPTQSYLSKLWTETLGLPHVHPNDEFVLLGGHSIAAMRIATRIRRDTGKPVKAADILGRPTISRFAAYLDRLIPAPPAEHSAAPTGEVPLSPFQHGMWLLHQVFPDCVAYNVPMANRLDGPLNLTALRTALGLLLARHEVLRTAFAADNAVATQRVSAPFPADLTIVNLTEVENGRQEDVLRQRMTQAVRTPFDLTVAPLWRSVVYQLGPDRHCLLLVVHHLVIDGWSVELLQRDLSLAYNAVRSGDVPDWPELPVQFADYSIHETGKEARERLRRELTYWKGVLAERPPMPRLPARARRPTTPSFTVDSVEGRLGAELARAVRSLAAQTDASPFSVLVSALAVVMSHYSGERKFHVGTPVTVRDQPGAEELIGFFVNSTILTCDLENDPTFRELVARTHGYVMGILNHPHVPFEDLVSELAPARVPGQNPFFEVWCNMFSFADHALDLGSLEIRAMRPPLAGALFELTVYLEDVEDDISVELVYRPDIFPGDRISTLHGHLCAVLEHAVAAPSERVGKLRPAAADRPRRAFAEGVSVSILEGLRSIDGDRTAVENATGTMSYAQLLRDVDELAERLATRTVGPGDVVMLATGRSPELLVGILATRLVGGCFLITDPAYPARRLEELAHMAGPKATVPDRHDRGFATAPRLPDEAAYIMFTSGSSGRPLGVIGSELPLATFFSWYAEEFGLGATDRFSALAGLSHDPLLRELLLPLLVGGTVCIPDADALSSPESRLRWLISAQVTVVHLTPSMAQLLAAAGAAVRLTAPVVRLVALGGGPISTEDHQAVRAVFPQAQVIGLYGTTETPQGISVIDVAAEFADQASGLHPPLGAGSPSAELLVLRDDHSVAAVNEIGEVCVRSPYLALGYLNEPELTAERFLPDLLDGRTELRIHRTGDVGRYRPDGSVEFLGRSDDQVLVNGQRVAFAEVELAARRHAAVRTCAAVARDGRIMLAVLAKAEPFDRTALARHLADQLPPGMLPTDIVLVSEIPLTANGKLDRARLGEHLAGLRESAGQPDPRDMLSTVGKVWRTVLGQVKIDPDVSFFSAGGTSLDLLKVHQILRDELKYDLMLADLFQYPTIGQLATKLASTEPDNTHMTSMRPRRPDEVQLAMALRVKARETARAIWVKTTR